MRISAAAVLVAGLMLSACATVPLQPPEQGKATVGIDLTFQTRNEMRGLFLKLDHLYPESIYFVKVEEGGDPLTQENVLVANSTSYLINVEPGQYAAVAALVPFEYEVPVSGTDKKLIMYGYHMIYFPAEMIRKTLVSVEPDSFAFMGIYWVKEPEYEDMPGAVDNAMRHYHKVLYDLVPVFKAYEKREVDLAELVEQVKNAKGYMMTLPYGGVIDTADRSAKAEVKFLKKALRRFKDSGWEPIIQMRLNMIKKIITCRIFY